MIFEGTVHKYGRDVDTDVIIPARYLNTNDPAELASHAMEDIDADFVNRVQPGDIIVADENFGCGSSREHAPVAIKVAGVSVVVAASFARIFYRNAINTGLPIVVCPAAAADAKMGDRLKVDLAAGTVENLTQGKTYESEAFPPFMQELIDRGGLLEYVKSRVERERLVRLATAQAIQASESSTIGKTYKIAMMPGDGVGPEIVADGAKRVLEAAAGEKFALDLLALRRRRQARAAPSTSPPASVASTTLQGHRRRAPRRRRRPQVGHHRPGQAAPRAGPARLRCARAGAFANLRPVKSF